MSIEMTQFHGIMQALWSKMIHVFMQIARNGFIVYRIYDGGMKDRHIHKTG